METVSRSEGILARIITTDGQRVRGRHSGLVGDSCVPVAVTGWDGRCPTLHVASGQ